MSVSKVICVHKQWVIISQLVVHTTTGDPAGLSTLLNITGIKRVVRKKATTLPLGEGESLLKRKWCQEKFVTAGGDGCWIPQHSHKLEEDELHTVAQATVEFNWSFSFESWLGSHTLLFSKFMNNIYTWKYHCHIYLYSISWPKWSTRRTLAALSNTAALYFPPIRSTSRIVYQNSDVP